MKLNYAGYISRSQIVGRILGPDLFNGYVVVTGVEYTTTPDHDWKPTEWSTHAVVKPCELETDTLRDDWGQLWTAEAYPHAA